MTVGTHGAILKSTASVSLVDSGGAKPGSRDKIQ